MINKSQYTYRGMNKDLSKSKRGPEFYYDANDIRIMATDQESTGSVTTEKGNTQRVSLDEGQIIIGAGSINQYIITFSTNDNGVDQINRLDSTNYTLFKLFEGDLNFNSSNLISVETYYEKDTKQKVYWVDGINQLRHLNIFNYDSDGNEIPYSQEQTTLFDIVPTVDFTSPRVITTSFGGTHTAGMISYAYNLINKGGSQSAISPMSPLYPLTKEKGGGIVNEVVGKINHVHIPHIDSKYDIIRVYAIKYTSYNGNPVISLISEQNIDGRTEITYLDDGRVVQNISQEQFLFLGGTPLIPETIASKYNRLILGNIKEEYFDITTEQFDVRAFRFPKNSIETQIRNANLEYETVAWDTTEQKYRILDGSFTDIAVNHDCINDTYKGNDTIIDRSKGSLKNIDSSITDPEGSSTVNLLVPTSNINKYEYVDVVYTSSEVGAPTGTFSFQYDASVSYVTKLVNVLNNNFNNSNFTTTAVGLELPGNLNFIKIVTTHNTTGNEIELVIQAKLYNFTAITITNTTQDLYQFNSSTYGCSGTNIDLAITTDGTNTRNVLKSNEVYRFAIEFYNDKGQTSPPKWICDLKMPEKCNLSGNDLIQLTPTIKNLDVLESLGVVGWRLLRVDRTPQDKTIITQGIVNGSMFQTYEDTYKVDPGGQHLPQTQYGLAAADEFNIKLPSPFMRTATGDPATVFSPMKDTPENIPPLPGSLLGARKLMHGLPMFGTPITTTDDNSLTQGLGALIDSGFTVRDPRYEIYRYNASKKNRDFIRHSSYQETRMFNFYSPEITFIDTPIEDSTYFKTKALVNTSTNQVAEWAVQYDIETQQVLDQAKYKGVVSLASAPTSKFNGFNQNALIGGTGNDEVHNKYQYYKAFSFKSYAESAIDRSIIGTPILTGTGERNLTYSEADGTRYQINNDLKTIVSDINMKDTDNFLADLFDGDKRPDRGVVSVNSVGHICLNIIEENETPLETILNVDNSNTFTDDANAGIIELRRNLENQYGGNTYEARSRNSYLRIGHYYSLRELGGATSYTYTVFEPGDTFVSNYRFARIMENISQVYDSSFYNMTEIVEFPVESSIDLDNRSDDSINGWDSLFQPSFDDYHNYNRVYSQQPTFNSTSSNIYTFEATKEFSNRINASKVKTSGELVDAWTDILINEELYLDGKYGKLFKLIRNNNYVYAFQERGISALSIQPRVQTQGNDGVAIELGTGAVLYDHTYLTTESGCVNSLAVFNSPAAVYYLDLGNKSINRIVGLELQGLSDIHGLHAYFENNLNFNTYKNTDNIHGIFDNINNEAYFTKKGLGGDTDFTIVFNEFTNSFTSFYSFHPTRYITSNYGLFSTPNNNGLWEHFTGDYGAYYGEDPVTSKITLLVNPQGNDCIFNNIEYKSEVYNGDVDVYNETLSTIKAWNEYQNTGTVPLIVGANVRRKFRNWGAFIPRDTIKKRARIRNPWMYLELGFDNTNNRKLILHDIIVSYDVVK